MPKGYPNSGDVQPSASSKFDINSLTQGGPDLVELPAGAEIKKLLDDEAFMHEIIQIRCGSTQDPHAPKAVEIGIDLGGVTGPMGPPTADYPYGTPGLASRGGKRVTYVFAYDQVYSVPRYVYEALAHAKMTRLVQTPHPTKPMEMMQQMKHSFTYNFECVHDPNPKGQAWREKVMSDIA